MDIPSQHHACSAHRVFFSVFVVNVHPSFLSLVLAAAAAVSSALSEIGIFLFYIWRAFLILNLIKID